MSPVIYWEAGNIGDSHPAASDDRDSILPAEDDAAYSRGRSFAAKDDDVHAPRNGIYVLRRFEWTGIILVNRKPSWNRAAVVHQQEHASSAAC